MKVLMQLVPDLLVVAGAGLALAGLYLLVGLAWCLLAAGVLAVALGAAIEIRRARESSWHS